MPARLRATTAKRNVSDQQQTPNAATATPHEIGIERQHGAQAGRDSLAASKLEINRKRMTQDRRQRDQDRQVGQSREPVSRLTIKGKPSVGRNPLSRSSNKTSRK